MSLQPTDEQLDKDTSRQNIILEEEDSKEECDEIVVEFEGNFDIRSIDDKKFKFLGLDTAEPILQVGQTFYKASFENIIGTNLIFDCDKERKLNYFTKTDKKIIMKRVFLKPKPESSSSE